MRTLRSTLWITMFGAALYATAAAAQQPIFYPAKGQSPQQQGKDTAQCQKWAQQTTGIDPAAPPPPPSGPAVGGGERLRGAAKGAILGEALGDNAGGGAVAGAMIGGAKARQKQASQQQAAQASQVSTFNRAVGACMEGRGYTVR